MKTGPVMGPSLEQGRPGASVLPERNRKSSLEAYRLNNEAFSVPDATSTVKLTIYLQLGSVHDIIFAIMVIPQL
jgi:hypothetical protein